VDKHSTAFKLDDLQCVRNQVKNKTSHTVVQLTDHPTSEYVMGRSAVLRIISRLSADKLHLTRSTTEQEQILLGMTCDDIPQLLLQALPIYLYDTSMTPVSQSLSLMYIRGSRRWSVCQGNAATCQAECRGV